MSVDGECCFYVGDGDGEKSADVIVYSSGDNGDDCSCEIYLIGEDGGDWECEEGVSKGCEGGISGCEE